MPAMEKAMYAATHAVTSRFGSRLLRERPLRHRAAARGELVSVAEAWISPLTSLVAGGLR